MDRKLFSPLVALLTTTGPLLLATASDRPNVLFIAVDDLNDWLGCMRGHPQALTPSIDRLAERGVLFTNAHCAAPACVPSRAAVFTGQMPANTGVWANGMPDLQDLRPDAFVLPSSFAESGYRTMGVGKLMDNGPEGRRFQKYWRTEQRWSPLKKGQTSYTPEELPTKSTNNPRHPIAIDGRTYTLPLNRLPSDRRPNLPGAESFDWGPFDVPDSFFGDTRITDWAIERLREESEEPLFLAVGYYRPHIPLWAPKRFFDRFEDSPAELPPTIEGDLDDLSQTARDWALTPITASAHSTVVEHNAWRAAVEGYLACATYVDHEIGRLVHALDASSYARNTLIVLWSDHGWHLGEKEHWGKWTGWERSTKAPLIIVPARESAKQYRFVGKKCDQAVSLIDIYPTLVELCKLDEPPHDLDGESLASLMCGVRGKERAAVTLFNPGNGSLRTNRWRYIRYADGAEELYDHERDPHEWRNIAENAVYAEYKVMLRSALQPYLTAPVNRPWIP